MLSAGIAGTAAVSASSVYRPFSAAGSVTAGMLLAVTPSAAAPFFAAPLAETSPSIVMSSSTTRSSSSGSEVTTVGEPEPPDLSVSLSKPSSSDPDPHEVISGRDAHSTPPCEEGRALSTLHHTHETLPAPESLPCAGSCLGIPTDLSQTSRIIPHLCHRLAHRRPAAPHPSRPRPMTPHPSRRRPANPHLSRRRQATRRLRPATPRCAPGRPRCLRRQGSSAGRPSFACPTA